MSGRLRSTPLLIRQPPRKACCPLAEPLDALAAERSRPLCERVKRLVG
jgi:hypothetical protein